MKNILSTCIYVAAIATLTACNSNSPTDTKDAAKDANDKKFENTGMTDDTKFAVGATDGGMMEVQLGKLAQTNAASQQVKDFGNMMISDHSKANDELKALAQKKNISLPAALSDKNQKDYNDLAARHGADFDKSYADYMVNDHKDDIDEFKKEAEKGNDAELKAWAGGKVSVLQHHLEMAQDAKDAVK